MKGENLKPLLKFMIVVLVVFLGIIFLISVYIVKSFVPSNEFEGVWLNTKNTGSGEIILTDTYYEDLIINIDEQSKSYGHIRIYFENEIVSIDTVYPILIKKNMIEIDDDDIKGLLKITDYNGIYVLEGKLYYKNGNQEEFLAINAIKIDDKADIFSGG